MPVLGKRPATKSLERWAITVLLEAGAIRECETHGWMLDRADPHARTRARSIACDEMPPGVSAKEAISAIEEVLAAIGDTCPDCEKELT